MKVVASMAARTEKAIAPRCGGAAVPVSVVKSKHPTQRSAATRTNMSLTFATPETRFCIFLCIKSKNVIKTEEKRFSNSN